MAVGSVAALHQGEQLEATAHLLQASQQGLLLVAAQAVEVDLASLATQAAGGMAGFMAAQGAAEARLSTTSATLAQAVQGRRAS